jgi:hypothetical protein
MRAVTLLLGIAVLASIAITFVVDSAGRATELILHQNGADQHARRVQ